MTINLDTEMLVDQGFTASEYIFLLLLYKEKSDLCWKICDDIDTHSLQKNGWLKKSGVELSDWTVRRKFITLISGDKDKMWYEFCSVMPFKVPNGYGGNRILRAKDPDAGTNATAKKLYMNVVQSNPELHKKIIKCIEAQLKEMRATLQYLQNSETWIRQRTWEKYEHLLTEELEENGESYGSKVI